MKQLVTVATVLMLVCIGISASAQEDEYRDVLEVSVGAGLTFPMGGISDWTMTNELGETELGTKSGMNLGFEVGYFWSENLITGVSFTYSTHGVDSDSVQVEDRSHKFYNVMAYAKYQFIGESDFVPYLKAGLGIDNAKFVSRVYDENSRPGGGWEYRDLSYDPGLSMELGAGVFWFTHDYGGLFLEANYHMGMLKDVVGDYQDREYTFGETASTFGIKAGIRVLFGSGE